MIIKYVNSELMMAQAQARVTGPGIFRLCSNHFMRRGLQLITARGVITGKSEARTSQSDQSEASNQLVTCKPFAKSQCQGVRFSDLCWNDDMQMIFDRTQREYI